MAKLVWDKTGEKFFESGVDHGVLYLLGNTGAYDKGYAWNGLISINETPSGAESNKQYADNIPYLNLISAEEFGLTVEAYTYPPEFGVCDGSAEPTPGVSIGQQDRKMFGMSYRTKIGNDTEGQDHGYKLHLVYGAQASPSEKTYNSINDSPEATTFSWEVTTTPVNVTGFKPTASIVIDSTKVDAGKLAELEKKLYGDDSSGTATLPTPDEVIAMLTPEE